MLLKVAIAFLLLLAGLPLIFAERMQMFDGTSLTLVALGIAGVLVGRQLAMRG